jgi:hypothetical protein
MVDRYGIDWWDILSLEMATELREMMLVSRLAKELSRDCELYLSRPCRVGTALHLLVGGSLTTVGGLVEQVTRRVRRNWRVLSRLDATQLAQVLEDKVDSEHRLRRGFARGHRPLEPAILLPSAYINGSRMAVRYAESLPNEQFLLVYTRRSGKISALPSNVQRVSLSPYFVKPDEKELSLLHELWNGVKTRLQETAAEFRFGDAAGVFESVPGLLRWGVALRDAWLRLLEAAPITGCLCTDDSNPPTRIPLLLARTLGLPTVAVHHGALDYAMTFKVPAADFHLAKTAMEEDFLRRVCAVPGDRVVLCGPGRPGVANLPAKDRQQSPWMVFFTEPYENYGWRTEEVYRDLLPRLLAVAQDCGSKLVFKLHPFESVRGHRKLLRSLLKSKARGIEIISGPLMDEQWPKVRFALTVQSSTALECSARGVPIFLCAWLRDTYSGYVQEFEHFAVGAVLQSPEQIADIPRLLREHAWEPASGAKNRPIEPALLASLFARDSAAVACA